MDGRVATSRHPLRAAHAASASAWLAEACAARASSSSAATASVSLAGVGAARSMDVTKAEKPGAS